VDDAIKSSGWLPICWPDSSIIPDLVLWCQTQRGIAQRAILFCQWNEDARGKRGGKGLDTKSVVSGRFSVLGSQFDWQYGGGFDFAFSGIGELI
jgi:hypothetical protein